LDYTQFREMHASLKPVAESVGYKIV
jgi:hypothetical protein